MVTRFEYETSKYDRRERENYGFAKVKTLEIDQNNQVYRSSINNFHNKSYHTAGLLKSSESYDSTGNLLSRTENTYNLYPSTNGGILGTQISANLFETYDSKGSEGRRSTQVLLAQAKNTNFENGNSIITRTELSYNNKAQVNLFKYFSNVSGNNYSTQLLYHDIPTLTSLNILNLPKEIKVFDSGNNLMRQRNTIVNSTTGDVNKVIVKLNSTENAVTNFTYNIDGNILSTTSPNGYKLTYSYDPLGKYYTTPR